MLDYFVTIAEGWKWTWLEKRKVWRVEFPPNNVRECAIPGIEKPAPWEIMDFDFRWCPSTSWHHGGAIMDRFQPEMFYGPNGVMARKDKVRATGQTTLVAAMRCYIVWRGVGHAGVALAAERAAVT